MVMYIRVHDVADSCSDRDVRLIDGTNRREGRVEVCNGGAWGTVCDDFWALNDGHVVCMQLGLGNGNVFVCVQTAVATQ